MLKKQVIIDTDIGDDIDDAYALAFALNSPELEIKAVLTNNGYEKERAQIAHKLIELAGKKVPVFQGVKGGKGRLSQKDFIKDSRFQPKKLEKSIKFFRKLFKNKSYYISLGSLTNVRFLLENIPFMKDKTKFFIMGGTIGTDYNGKKRLMAEWNIVSDIISSQKVFDSGADITMVGLDCTWNLKLVTKNVMKIEKSEILLNKALNKLRSYWRRHYTRRNLVLHDPLTIAILIDTSLAKFQDYKIYVDGRGRTIQNLENGKNVTVAIKLDKQKFLRFFMQRLLLSPK